MRIGTTPTHRFELPFSADLIADVEITYKQSGKEILKKHKEDCTIDGKAVSTRLSQDDTFLFSDVMNVEIQIRVLTTGDDVVASPVYVVSAEKCLSDEVL